MGRTVSSDGVCDGSGWRAAKEHAGLPGRMEGAAGRWRRLLPSAEGQVLSPKLQPGHCSKDTWTRGSQLYPTMAQHPGCRTRGSPAREKRWLQAAQEALKGAGWGPQGPGLQRRQSPASLGLLALCLAGDRCLRPVSTTPACPSPAAAHRPFSKTQFSP